MSSSVLMQHTAIIVPNGLVSTVESLIEQYNKVFNPVNSQILPEPAISVTNLLREAVRQDLPEIAVYSENICQNAVHCFREDCKLVHFVKHLCRHGNNCLNNNINDCGFRHQKHDSVTQQLPNGSINLYRGWEDTMPLWSKTVEGRAKHFKQRIIPIKIEGETNIVIYKKSKEYSHNVCIDWMISKCYNSKCNYYHFIPSSYKYYKCQNWLHNVCHYTSRTCNDIHGEDDIIVKCMLSKTNKNRSRSRSRERK